MEFEKCLNYALEKHIGQLRHGGDEYITHPIAVAAILKEKEFGIEYQIAALFHDLLEDTDATYEEIEDLSSREVAEAVRLVTKIKPYVLEEYLENISSNKIAFMVKLADRLHNIRSAKYAPISFAEKYLKETVEYYLEFSKGTVFENEIHEAVIELKKMLENK